MIVELNEKQQTTLDLALAWGVHPKNVYSDATFEVAKNIRSGWLKEDHLLDHVRRGFELALRGCA